MLLRWKEVLVGFEKEELYGGETYAKAILPYIRQFVGLGGIVLREKR